MLRTNLIPGYSEESHDWHVFLYKAAKGSSKATDILADVSAAYMVALTSDKQAPENLPLTDFRNIFVRSFMHVPRPLSAQEICDAANENGWFPFLLDCWPEPVNAPDAYIHLWKRGENVLERDLAHDAVHFCHDHWMAAEFHEFIRERSPNYNSLQVVCAMIYLALSWPE